MGAGRGPVVKHSDFRLGMEFEVSGLNRFRVTDLGTRVVVAICLTQHDPSWFRGPPYAIPEMVFDENDFPACQPLSTPG